MQGKKAIVTGGAGFIGSHVVRSLLDKGCEVVVLDDLSGGDRTNLDERVVFIEGSIDDHKLVDAVFEVHHFDYVYHLAAYAAEGLSHFIRRFNYTNNLIGSVNLINAAVKHKVKCFVFTSSIAVNGDQPSPLSEQFTPQPIDPYGIAKYAVELDLKSAHGLFGLNYIVFRPHNVYGENQNIGDRYRNVVGIFMNQLMRGEDLTIFGDGEQTRAFSYIDDVAPVIAGSVEIEAAYNEVFNIGSDHHHSVNTLANAVMEAMEMEGQIRYESARHEVVHAFADHSKAKKIFQLEKEVPLQRGLEKMARWAKEVSSRKSSRFGPIEIDDQIPPIWKS